MTTGAGSNRLPGDNRGGRESYATAVDEAIDDYIVCKKEDKVTRKEIYIFHDVFSATIWGQQVASSPVSPDGGRRRTHHHDGRPRRESPDYAPDRPQSVDNGLSVVGARRDHGRQGHDKSESTPGHRRWSASPGSRRPKGHDRLMTKVQAGSDSAPARCPSCGSTASATDVRTREDMATGSYLCSAGHLWITKWSLLAPGPSRSRS